MMKYINAIPILMLFSILFPIAYITHLIAEKLMKITILLVDYLPEIND